MKHLTPAGENLIGAEHDPMGIAAADRKRLLRGKARGESGWIVPLAFRSRFDRTFVHIGALRLDRQACADQQRKARRAGRGKKEFL